MRIIDVCLVDAMRFSVDVASAGRKMHIAQ